MVFVLRMRWFGFLRLWGVGFWWFWFVCGSVLGLERGWRVGGELWEWMFVGGELGSVVECFLIVDGRIVEV